GPLPMESDVYDSIQRQSGGYSSFYSNQTMGQLAPFPDATIPAPSCVPGTFVSFAKASFTAPTLPTNPYAGTIVTLSSAGSVPVTGPFAWTQIIKPGDPVVSINNPNSATATFTAPLVAVGQNLAFQLTVGDGVVVPFSAPTSVIVPITVPPAGA